jgi:hypothetical protein
MRAELIIYTNHMSYKVVHLDFEVAKCISIGDEVKVIETDYIKITSKAWDLEDNVLRLDNYDTILTHDRRKKS